MLKQQHVGAQKGLPDLQNLIIGYFHWQKWQNQFPFFCFPFFRAFCSFCVFKIPWVIFLNRLHCKLFMKHGICVSILIVMTLYFKSLKLLLPSTSSLLIFNGNWTEWSAIWSEIIRVISKSWNRKYDFRPKLHNTRVNSSITTLLHPFRNDKQ